jgi:hypothetical protein
MALLYRGAPCHLDFKRERTDLLGVVAGGDWHQQDGDWVMFTMATGGLRGQAKHREWSPTKAVRLAALLGTLVLVSIAVNGLIILADGSKRARSLAAGACAPIAENTDRLVCYDKLASQPAPHPFRGANAPAL